ncbi:MAG: SsrA-binding protein SmpB [Parcubacteria group bacterium]|nr:SsrA-binding protein SmpB [Parcubacteria group bacterium]
MALVSNKKAYHNYEIEEKLEAGIELLGHEVKSLKGGRGSLEGAYVITRGKETFLVNMNIPPYQVGNVDKEYDPYRLRKLLLNKREIATLLGVEKEKGLTIMPLSVYNKSNKIKVEIGIARGKKKYDKRETLKRRTAERDVEREAKSRLS